MGLDLSTLRVDPSVCLIVCKRVFKLQGRVFAANSLVLELVSAIATLIAGPLSDRILEPAMQSQNSFSSLFAPIFGNGAGAGMALLYVGCAIAMFSIGVVGFRLPQLHRLED